MKKKNKVISYLPSESSYGLPSCVFHAVLMRVACRNPVLLVLLKGPIPRFKTITVMREQELDTSVWARERCLCVLKK